MIDSGKQASLHSLSNVVFQREHGQTKNIRTEQLPKRAIIAVCQLIDQRISGSRGEKCQIGVVDKIFGVIRRAPVAGEIVIQIGQEVGEQSGENVLLAGEIIVESAGGKTRAPDDVTDG